VNALGRMMVRRQFRPADLAALSGISGRKLYNILNNRTYPTEMDLFSLARALDCKPDDIRERT
jgi:DNA-binding Xre family transcriptional regulator